MASRGALCLGMLVQFAAMMPASAWRPPQLASAGRTQVLKSPALGLSSLPLYTVPQLRVRRSTLSLAMSGTPSESGPKQRAKKMPKKMAPATEEDMAEFVGILANVRNGNETEIPALMASKVEFLLSRDIAALMQRLDAQCANADERSELNELFNVVIDFVEQFVGNTARLNDANGQLLREIFEAAAAGMQALDLKMRSMLSGNDERYTPEFIRFLDAEILRLRSQVAKLKDVDSKPAKKGRFADGKTIDLNSLGQVVEEDDDEEEEAPGPDAAAALQTLCVIKARISAEMEEHLGDDAWAAQLLSRLLQVDKIPLRIVALRTALGEMPDPQARAQFYDVVMSTAADVKELSSQGQPIDPDLVGRLEQMQDATARELGLKK